MRPWTTIWDDRAGRPDSSLRVDESARIWIVADGSAGAHRWQEPPSTLDLLGPFECGHQRGPDLLRPRPSLRIIPGRVSGEPHLAGSRVTTPVAAALYRSIPDVEKIAEPYPGLGARSFEEAIELEQSLAA